MVPTKKRGMRAVVPLTLSFLIRQTVMLHTVLVNKKGHSESRTIEERNVSGERHGCHTVNDGLSASISCLLLGTNVSGSGMNKLQTKTGKCRESAAVDKTHRKRAETSVIISVGRRIVEVTTVSVSRRRQWFALPLAFKSRDTASDVGKASL